MTYIPPQTPLHGPTKHTISQLGLILFFPKNSPQVQAGTLTKHNLRHTQRTPIKLQETILLGPQDNVYPLISPDNKFESISYKVMCQWLHKNNFLIQNPSPLREKDKKTEVDNTVKRGMSFLFASFLWIKEASANALCFKQ